MDAGDGFAKNDAVAVKAYRSELLRWDANDEETRAKVVAINGQPIVFGKDVDLGDIKVALTQKGTLNVKPTPAFKWNQSGFLRPKMFGGGRAKTAYERLRCTITSATAYNLVWDLAECDTIAHILLDFHRRAGRHGGLLGNQSLPEIFTAQRKRAA